MKPLDPRIASFLAAHHVVGLATVVDGLPWAASCFYAFDASPVSLIVLTAEQTRHGEAMQRQGVVAGTVAGQPTAIADIRGVQFLAQAQRLAGAEEEEAYALYCRRHPIARLRKAPVWRLAIQRLKYTDNARVFGDKLCWQRESDDNPLPSPT